MMQRSPQLPTPDDAERPPRRMLTAVLWLLPLLLGAAAIAWSGWQGLQAVQLLRGLTDAREAMRALYDSREGYGLPDSAKAAAWTAQGAGAHWQTERPGLLRHDSGVALSVRPQRASFELELDQLPAAQCRLLLRLLDGNWGRIRLDGREVLPAAGLIEAGTQCGWLRPSRMSLSAD